MVVLVALALAGCAGGKADSTLPEEDKTEKTVKPLPEEPVEEPEPAPPTPSGNYKVQQYEQTCTTDEGYKIKRTYRIGEMLRGDDRAALDDAWLTVGGEGVAPTFETDYAVLGGEPNPSNSVYIYGSYEVENVTGSGYSYDSISDTFYGASVVFKQGDEDNYGPEYENPRIFDVGSAQLGSGLQYDSDDRHLMFLPEMSSDKWGPVPFGMVVTGRLDTIFSPKYPDGYPSVVSGSALSIGATVVDDQECVPDFSLNSRFDIPLSFHSSN